MDDIYGIPCNIDDKRIIVLITQVLGRIQDICPPDWKKIKRWVLGFDWLDENDPKFTSEMNGACVWLGGSPATPSQIYFARRIVNYNDMFVAAIVAHELGHAATSRAELRAMEIDRHPVYGELCASRYVFKWGFVKEYAMYLFDNDAIQHCGGLPGDKFVLKSTDGELQYRIGLNFKPIFLRAVDENGQVIEIPPVYKLPS